MPKHRTLIMEELDPQSVDSFTDAQKQYYASMGYKPYLNADGKVVWLSPALHSLRIHGKIKRPFLHKLLIQKKIQAPLQRKRRSWFKKFIRNNWVFFLIIVGVTIFVLYYIRFWL